MRAGIGAKLTLAIAVASAAIAAHTVSFAQTIETSVPAEAVFILGDDAPGRTAFYSSAEAYYRASFPRDRLLITRARSLEEVREILQHRGSGHWRRVVLVVHGTAWEGMMLPVHPGGERASYAELLRAAKSGAFPPVDDERIDADTEWVLESCSLGLRPDYLSAVSKLFGGDDEMRPNVVASRRFVAYAIAEDDSGAAPRYVRMELPMASRIVPGSPSVISADRLQRYVADLRRDIDDDRASSGASARWSVVPIRIEASVPATRSAGRSPVELARSEPALREALRGYNLERGRLAWTWADDPSDSAERRIVGEATLILMHADPRGLLNESLP
ncbi:MAG: hypothetical protein IT473_06780 [Lysobacter sp.]|nr:hypothetical protein [Lysobacter sp.]